MRFHEVNPIGLGSVIDLARPSTPTVRGLHEPVYINGMKLVPSASNYDLYRKTDVDVLLQPQNPYLNFSGLSENLKVGGIDASSPYLASIGSGTSKVVVYSIFANAGKNGPTFRGASTGISTVYIDNQDSATQVADTAWSVVSNGTKFFAYPINTSTPSIRYVKTSTDGITWTSEEMTGDHPTSFSSANTHRWYYNIPPSGIGMIPTAAKTPDYFSIGQNIFLLNESSIYRSSDGLGWSNITTGVFGNAIQPNDGFYIGINKSLSTAFIASSYGLKYTTDSGLTWSKSIGSFTVPTTYGFSKNPNSDSKYLAKNYTPNNLYYISTDTGKTWNRITPGTNADVVMYRNSSIVLLQKESGTSKFSLDDGTTWANTVFPSTFVYPIKTGLCTDNYKYILDSDFKIYRSPTGATWTLIGSVPVQVECFGIGKSINSTTDIIYSGSDQGQLPYICIYNDGANIVSGRLGEYASSVIAPAINGSTDVVVCNGNTQYAGKCSLADITSPPYIRFTPIKIETGRTGTIPYIRIG